MHISVHSSHFDMRRAISVIRVFALWNRGLIWWQWVTVGNYNNNNNEIVDCICTCYTRLIQQSHECIFSDGPYGHGIRVIIQLHTRACIVYTLERLSIYSIIFCTQKCIVAPFSHLCFVVHSVSCVPNLCTFYKTLKNQRKCDYGSFSNFRKLAKTRLIFHVAYGCSWTFRTLHSLAPKD